MRICMTVNSSPWSHFKGGGQIAVHYLACAFSKQGHEVHVIYSKGPDENISLDLPYQVHWVRHFNIATINLNIFSFAFKLWRLTGMFRFDVIHGNAEEAFFFPIIARLREVKFFFTSHAPFIPSAGFLGIFWRPIFFLKRLNSLLLRNAAKNARRIFTFSEFSRNLIVEGLGVESYVRIVNPGVGTDWMSVERSPSISPQLIFWGRMEDEKGVPELIEALGEIKTAHSDIVLHLIGEGSQLEIYRKRVDQLGLSNHIVFHQWMEADDIKKLARTCRVGVFPSHIESFGLAVVEAMAVGLPIVATRVGALPEFVQEGKSGILVRSGDRPQLIKAILEVLANAEKYEKMAGIVKNEIGQKFSWDLTARKILSHYQN